MNREVIGGLVQILLARSVQDPTVGQALLDSLIAAVDDDTGPLRGLVREQQAATVAQLEQIQSVNIPE